MNSTTRLLVKEASQLAGNVLILITLIAVHYHKICQYNQVELVRKAYLLWGYTPDLFLSCGIG
jgi:hypothetical protein